jgi:hypothetical protein
MRAFLFLIPASLLFLASCGNDTESKPAESTTPAASPSSASSAPQAGSPEETAMKLANLVIANDQEGLMGMIISPEEMKDVIANSSVMPQGKETAIKNIPTAISQMRADMTKGLTEVRSKCEEAGVVWENCRYKDARYEINNPTGYNMMQLHCIMDCNGMEYTFTLTDVAQTENGWRLGGIMYYGDAPPQKSPNRF